MAGSRADAFEVGAVAERALRGFGQRFALLHRTHRYVSDERRTRIAISFRHFRADRNLDDAIAERLGLIAIEREEEADVDASFRGGGGFLHGDPAA